MTVEAIREWIAISATFGGGKDAVAQSCAGILLIERLCEYEDVEEQGLLVRLPCKVGSHVWRVWITDGRKPEITEHYMSDLLHIVQWIDKFGKTVFRTRE